MRANIGEIYYANMSQSDEKTYYRPVIIVKDDSHNDYVYAVPLTTSFYLYNEYTVVLENFIDGKELIVGVQCNKLLKVDKIKLSHQIGKVNNDILSKIKIEISKYLNLDINISSESSNESNITNDDKLSVKEPEIVLKNSEEFYKMMINVSEFASQYQKNNSRSSVWKERLINGVIGFFFGLLTSFLF